MNELLGLEKIFEAASLGRLGLRLVIDLFFAGIVVWSYKRRGESEAFRFTYLLFNIVTFSLCFILLSASIELGFALGLFAVFGILRYRTEAIGIRNLTYLFIMIGLAILNAVAGSSMTLVELLAVNGIIVGATVLFDVHTPEPKSEPAPVAKKTRPQEVIYDDLELLRSGDRGALIADIEARTGMSVQELVVKRFDLLRDLAVLTVTFEPLLGEERSDD